MTLYYLGMGSNDQAEQSCRKMIMALRDRFGSLTMSSVVKTHAVGMDANDYLNGVVCFHTSMLRHELSRWCKQLEHRLGRVRGGAVCRADLDILMGVEHADLSILCRLIEHNVTEEYYLTLIKELLLFQTKKPACPLLDTVALELDNRIVGSTPTRIYVKETTCSCA